MFLRHKLKCKILRKPGEVAGDSLIEVPGSHAIKPRNVGIGQYTLSAHNENALLNKFGADRAGSIGAGHGKSGKVIIPRSVAASG